jgi:two-component system, cell cycle sensor histidine kinase and response regulator CckA
VPTVLIVDDEPIIRNVVRLALTKEGYAVMDAAGAFEADALCRSLGELQIDLLIINHRLAAEKGRHTAEKIAGLYPAIRVLVISGLPYDAVQREEGIMPGSSFLQKPFTAQQLLSTVQNILFPNTQ